jgi:hypothetical protein
MKALIALLFSLHVHGVGTFNLIHFMTAFWAVFTFEGSGSAITAQGLLDLKKIQIHTWFSYNLIWFTRNSELLMRV